MPTVIHSTQAEFGGPAILDKSALERLDDIFARESDRLRALRESVLLVEEQTELEKEKREHLRRYGREMSDEELRETLLEIRDELPRKFRYRPESLQILLKLKSGKKVSVSSFDEAARSTELIGERVVSLDVEYVVNELDANISTAWSGGSLSVKVRPETSPSAGELYSVLRDWCESTKSPAYLKLWFWARQNSFFVVIVCFFILALFTLSVTSPNAMKQRAGQFARDGVPPGQEREALQTLLALAVNYEPPSSYVSHVGMVWALFVLFALIVVFSQFAPKFEIGLGVGVKRINRQRTLGKFFLISIPVYVLSLLVGHYWK
jgi:hypothetical protein